MDGLKRWEEVSQDIATDLLQKKPVTMMNTSLDSHVDLAVSEILCLEIFLFLFSSNFLVVR